MKNVTEYAVTVGESVKTSVQDAVCGKGTIVWRRTNNVIPYLQPSFMNKFQEEQDKFTRESRRLRDAAVPPWVGYNEEEQMKAQILELSAVRYIPPSPLPLSSLSYRTAGMCCVIHLRESSSTLTLPNRTLLPWQC